MKPYKLLICCLMVLSGIAGAGGTSSWSDADYSKHTFETFASYGPALGRIDMKNIDYPLLHAAIFYETNRQRAANGLPAFGHSPALEKSAAGHSADMVGRNFFSHESPVRGKETLARRLALVGIKNAFSAENIALCFGIEYEAGKGVFSPDQNGGYFSYEYRGTPIENHTYIGLAKAALKGWMESPGHRKNILNGSYTYLGAGAAHYRNRSFHNMDNFKLTQNFSSVIGE